MGCARALTGMCANGRPLARVGVRVRASCHVHAFRLGAAPPPAGRARRLVRAPPRPAAPRRCVAVPSRCVAVGSPTPRVRVVRLLGMGDGGDLAPSDKDHRGPSVAGAPDRRPPRPDRGPPRPLVSPTQAQGSYQGTNRVVIGAPKRLAGLAAPRLSTRRAAQSPGRDRRCWRSSTARTWRVSRNCPGRRGGCSVEPRRPTGPGRRAAGTGRFHLNSHPETGMRAGGAVRRRRACPAPAPRGALSTRRSASRRAAPDRAGDSHIRACGRICRRKPGSGWPCRPSPGGLTRRLVRAPRPCRPSHAATPRAGASSAPRARRPRAFRLGAAPAPRPPRARRRNPRRAPLAANPARRYNPGRCRTPSSS